MNLPLKNSMPNISVIIPVYNHAQVLDVSLRSLANQTLKPSQVIIVDDGSQEKVSKVLDLKKYSFDIKIIEQPNLGASQARNNGYKVASGDLVIFWDADTLAAPDMLERLWQALDANPGAAYVYCDYEFGFKLMRSQPFNAEVLKKVNYIDTTCLIRKAALTKLPTVFDNSLKRFQDWDLWLTLLEKNKTGVYVPGVLFKKMVGSRRGISRWLPKILFKLPFKIKAVQEYEVARQIVLSKHALN